MDEQVSSNARHGCCGDEVVALVFAVAVAMKFFVDKVGLMCWSDGGTAMAAFSSRSLISV